MKKWWLLGILVLGFFLSRAQSNFFFGHYMFNPSYLNPGWSGSEQQAFVAFQHRSQWVGYSSSFDGSGGAPNTQMLTGIVPIRGFVISSIGINISNDNLGPQSNFQVQLPLTYTLELRKGQLHLGAAPGVFSQTQKFNQLRPNEPDPLIQGGSEVQTKFNLSAGLFYSSNDGWFMGLGAVNLMRPGFDFGQEGLSNKQELSIAMHGGYSFKINDDLKIAPTALIRSNLTNVTFDLGGIVTLREKMWGGLSYRRDESAIIYLGYGFLEDNRLKVGYSFDFVFQNQAAKAPTSHEIFIRYDLPDLVFGGRKTVKTPRFTF